MLLLGAAAWPARASLLAFEIVGTPSVFTDPGSFTTSDILNDQRDGARYTHNIGVSNWTADFTVAPTQWLTDEILILLGLNNSTEPVGVSVSETVMSYTTVLRLTGVSGGRRCASRESAFPFPAPRGLPVWS